MENRVLSIFFGYILSKGKVLDFFSRVLLEQTTVYRRMTKMYQIGQSFGWTVNSARNKRLNKVLSVHETQSVINKKTMRKTRRITRSTA